jgi:long-subunit acyl-CoA synthetase (AMP-forming)
MYKYSSFQEMLQKRQSDPSGNAIAYFDGTNVVFLSNKDFCQRVFDFEQTAKKDKVGCVAIVEEKSADMLVHFFGYVLAGVRTCIIDSNEPIEKISQIFDTLKPEKALFSQSFEQSEIKNLGWHLSKEKTLPLKEEGEVIFFTSGTSGPSKGVVLTSKSLVTSAFAGQSMLPCSKSDIILSMLPYSHVFGFVCTLLWPLCYGATAAIGRGMRHLLEDPNLFKPTILPVIPSLGMMLLSRNALNQEIKTILVGAGPLPHQAVSLFQANHIGLAFGYGLTETSSGVAISVNAKDPYAMSPCPGNEFKIENDGSISIRSESVMKGYIGEDIANPLKDGWLSTNDVGFIDRNGNIHINGRKDDILVLDNGTKFDCIAAEARLGDILPQVDIAFKKNDNHICLVWFSKVGNEDLLVNQAVDEFNASQPIYAKISEVAKLDHPIPRTQTGKIKRFML